jgi:hypothetical protein
MLMGMLNSASDDDEFVVEIMLKYVASDCHAPTRAIRLLEEETKTKQN